MDATTQMKPYPAYKPSGVEWLGDIPEHWEVARLGALIEPKSVKNRSDLQILSVYREYGVIPKDSRDDNHNVTSSDTSSYKAVKPGYLVVNKMKAWQGSMGISAYEGIVSPAYITCSITSSKVEPLFLHQLLRCHSCIGEYNRLSYGIRIGQWDMHYEDFKKIPLPIPPLHEQRRIAAFLDSKTALIDNAIASKKKLIELLQEYKQILIHDAVTRGVHHDVPMKPSGVEWLGDIPEHWEVKKLKYFFTLITDKQNTHSQKIGLENIESKTGIFIETDTTFEGEGISFKRNDILFGKLRPYLAKVWKASFDGQAVGDFYIFRPTAYVFPDFAKYRLLDTSFIDTTNGSTYGSKMPRVSWEFISQIPLALPPLHEQRAIAEYIERQSASIARAIALQEQHIEKLAEYRSTLINSAVTGAIKV